MTTKVEYQSESGQRATGELVLPPGEGRVGAVMVFHEWWGLNDHMRSIIEKIAAQGFLTLCLDLFDGTTTRDAAEAAKMLGALDWERAMDRAKGAFAYLKQHPRANGKVAALGFCMGGALTFAAAVHVRGLSAVVPFYGLPGKDISEYDAIDAPVLGHFAKRDDWVKPEAIDAIRERLLAQGKSIKTEFYEADHAFVNDTRPEVYSPDNAKLALDRTFAFLKQHLA
ncbi:MAG: dienelactone hydrolase family protein [Polyangiaceae bacterium]|nr:dienelactone hydrolase family protein [Polyangiaceae bacterium]